MKLKGPYVATIVTIILITVMTILSEISKSFKTLLADTFWHHWIGKGIIALVVFFLIALLFEDKERDIYKITKLTVSIGIIGGLVIFLFYVFHFFN